MKLMGEKKRCFMKTLEEKKKIWEVEREQKIAERMAKAAAWRAEAQAKRLKSSLPILPRVVEKLEKIEIKAVKKNLGEFKPKKKEIKRVAPKKKLVKRVPKKRAVKPKLEKIFVKKKMKKPGSKRKAVAGKKSAPVLAKEIGEKVREEIRKPIRAFEKKLNKKIEEISAVKAGLRPKKKSVKRKKPALKPRAGEEIVKPPEKELVTAILEEKPMPKAEPAKEIPKIEKSEEKKPVETETLSGIFTDISMPKTKEEKEFDWSAKRFKELEEKLQRLRRF